MCASVLFRPSAKVRLAAMALNVQQLEVANNHLKDALTAHPANSELRAYYLYFLVQTASTLAFNASAIKQAIDFAYNTLREHRSDVYTLSAAGWLNYRQGREMKPHAKDAHTDAGMAAFGRERSKYYARAAELYEKALLVDPECSFAAQALAIAVAENALALPGAATNEDSRTRIANARQALGVFQRVRETLMDGSVYVNMGHCYFANDEFERAIESVRLLALPACAEDP
jgi:RNA polymerase-associated protein CTR9